jgi:hypothetical protein
MGFGGIRMVSAFLLSCAFLAASEPADLRPSQADLAVYEGAREKVGRDADAHVKLSLWCEAHGLSAERIKHLAIATLINPNHAAARGLLGLIANEGKWQKPEVVGSQLASNPERQALIREYLQRRAATPNKADAQWKLAQWCEQSSLNDQAQAHYGAVVRLDPKREGAWKKLGYKKSGAGWAKADQIAADKVEAEHQKLANKHWKPILEKHREGIVSKDATRRTRAETALGQISDPRAVPAVWDVLASGDERCQKMALQVLGQIDGPAASRAVAAIALFSPFAEVRGRAIETVVRRDPRDFLESLLTLIRRPFRYRVQPLGGPGSEGGLFIDGERFNIQRLYQVDPVDPRRMPQRFFSPDVPFNPFTAANMMMVSGWTTGDPNLAVSALSGIGQAGSATTANPAKAISQAGRQTAAAGSAVSANFVLAMQMAALERDQQIARVLSQIQDQVRQAQESLAQDIQTVESWNQGIREVNDRVLPIVKTVTGQDLGADRDAWLKWWNNEQGYAYQSPPIDDKPTYTQLVSVPVYVPPVHSACFGAGTSVRTLDGPRAIETLQVGDRVLSQNTTSGALSFQPVMVIHHNPPSATLKLRLGGETIVVTGIHRFWKAGKGWTMARDLRPGDIIRTVGGTVRLHSVEAGSVQPVFNLDVAENRNFFVGNQGCLVYDFSIVQPVLVPFDRQPELAALRAKAQ